VQAMRAYIYLHGRHFAAEPPVVLVDGRAAPRRVDFCARWHAPVLLLSVGCSHARAPLPAALVPTSSWIDPATSSATPPATRWLTSIARMNRDGGGSPAHPRRGPAHKCARRQTRDRKSRRADKIRRFAGARR
jgi:hypothetical protein